MRRLPVRRPILGPRRIPSLGDSPAWYVVIGGVLLTSLLFVGTVVGGASGAPDSAPPGGRSDGAPGIDFGRTAAGVAAVNEDEPDKPGGGASPGDVPATIDWTNVARKVIPTIVSVEVGAAPGAGSQGSGVILSESGEVLTNDHVLAAGGVQAGGAGGDVRVTVVLGDGSSHPAEVVGQDPRTDLAVLRITSPPDLRAAKLGDSDRIEVGQPVIAVGSPLGLSQTVTSGIISAEDRTVTTSAPTSGGADQAVITKAIQTDASVNPGSSGGALVNSAGEVIGIPSSIVTLGSEPERRTGNIGVAFAIPINEARQVAEQLMQDGVARHAWLGVQARTDYVEVGDGTRRAAVIEQVVPGSPAERAGLAVGDAILTFDRNPVLSADSLAAEVLSRRPGDRVGIARAVEGRSSSVSVTLADRPDEGQANGA